MQGDSVGQAPAGRAFEAVKEERVRAWTFLIVSSLFEVGWIVSLKMTSGFSRFVPLAG